jgi:RimJ/RimL family protein N-acetyltransferase
VGSVGHPDPVATTLTTDRLLLRSWRDDDRVPFATMNADPRVMEHFQAPLTRLESDALIEEFEDRFDPRGFGLWALEQRERGEFIGFTGLAGVPWAAHFTPAIEVGWRLKAEAWGHGYATEAAREAVRFAFDHAGLDEIVSFTVPANVRSRAVMVRLGMTHDPTDDFDNPRLPEGHPLRRHVLYRLDRESWAAECLGFDLHRVVARAQGAGGGTSFPDSTGLKFSTPMLAKSVDANQAKQSLAVEGSSESQIPIRWGEPSLTMTADQSPAFSPETVVCSVLPATAHVSPSLVAQPSLTVWVPSRNVVTAVPEIVAPSATTSTCVVTGAPSSSNCTVPPNAPLGLGVAATDAAGEAVSCAGDGLTDAGVLGAGADADGAALPVAPAQPATRSALTRTPRIARMLIPPIGLLTM